jgi:hypothetical protein
MTEMRLRERNGPVPEAQAQTRRIKKGHYPGYVAATYRFGIGEPRRPHSFAFQGQKKTDLVALCRCQWAELQYLGIARSNTIHSRPRV